VVLESRFRNRNGKCGTPKMIGALSDRYSRPAASERRAGSLEGSTKDAARMAGPSRICFASLFVTKDISFRLSQLLSKSCIFALYSP
jgi:hypothetical protein